MSDAPAVKPDWRFEHPGTLGSTGLTILANGTLLAMQERGIPLPAGNRATRARNTIVASHDGSLRITSEDPATLSVVAAAIREMWEFHLITRTLPQARTPDLDGQLKVMLTGSRWSHKPRDFQFQGLVGALFAMAGLRAWPAEPDLQFVLDETRDAETFGVAVKRIRSSKKLAARTTEARKQLEKQGLRGFIAVNVDAFLEGVPADGMATEVGARFDAAIAKLHDLLPGLAEWKSLLGVMMIGAVAGWTFDGGKPRVFHPLIFQGRSFARTPKEQAITDAVFNALERGVNARVAEVYREIDTAKRRFEEDEGPDEPELEQS